MNRKQLKKQYAQATQPMGVYQVKNKKNGKLFIDSGLNINGKINRCKFQLSHGSHMNTGLQEDFKKFGEENFEFEILDFLDPTEDSKVNYAEELKMLEEMWIEKLQPFDGQGYNRRKL